MKFSRVVPVLAVALLVGCGVGQEDEGSPQAVFGVGAADVSVPLEISEITDVVATVSAADIPTPIVAKLAVIQNMATGLIAAIPAGTARTFSIHAYVGAVLVCTGSTSADIVADTRARVDVTLDCSVPPAASGEAEVVADFNFPPEILSVSASPSSVVVDGTVSLEVTATDPNGDALTYLWSATDGTFDVTDAATAAWTAPSVAGDYSITIDVSDGVTTVSVTIVIVVTAS